MLIKTKLLLISFIGLLSLATIITTISVYDSTLALEEAQMEKLSSVEASKSGEIDKYFKSLESLLVSLANHKGTKDAFKAFESGFYTLSDEIDLDTNMIKREIKEDFTKNFLDSVNYNVPNSEQRKSIDQYLPTDINALIAQYIFIVNNSAPLGEKNNLIFESKYDSSYMQAHKKYHQSFDNFLKGFELYDIFMVDLKGNLIYTDFKEKDFATNLKTGVYSNTGIARAYKKALDLGENQLAFDDFSPYEPSYNASASFIATPLYIDGTKQGVLIFQMPVDRINTIMNFEGKYQKAGLGESGEVYLVGQDYKMRSNSRFVKDIKDDVIQQLGSTIGVWQVKTASTEAVITGSSQSGKGIIQDYRGVNVLSVYNTIDLYGQTKWAIVSEIDEEEALNPAIELRNLIVISSVIVLIIAVLIFLYFINHSIVKPLHTFQEGLMSFFKYLNKESDEVPHLDDSTKHEIGRMSQVINENITKTKVNLQKDKELIDETIAITDKINKGYLDGRINAVSNYPALNQLKDILNETIATLNENLENIKVVLKSYTEYNYHPHVDKNNMEGVIEELIDGINTLGDSITESLVGRKRNGLTLQSSANTLKNNVDSLSTSANEAAASLEETAAALEEITATIISNSDNVTEMATYANKVTNSSSEGESLANNTMHAMDEINDQVTSINEAITVIDQIAFQTNILSLNAAVEAATAGEAGKGFAVVAQEVRNLASRSAEAAKEIKDIVETATIKANAGKEIAQKMLHGYSGLNQDIDKTIELIKRVDAASKEQQEGIEQINDAVTQLDQQTQRNSAAAMETNDIAITTEKLAETILDGVNRNEFKGKEEVIDRRKQDRDLNYQGPEKRRAEKQIKSSSNRDLKSGATKTTMSEIKEKPTDGNKEWESF